MLLDLMLSMDLKFVARFNVWKFAARSNVMSGLDNIFLFPAESGKGSEKG